MVARSRSSFASSTILTSLALEDWTFNLERIREILTMVYKRQAEDSCREETAKDVLAGKKRKPADELSVHPRTVSSRVREARCRKNDTAD